MADITSLGIDISSFSIEKLKILNDYISAFDKLDKFDKKTFKPVSAGGLTELNNSIKDTTKLLDDLNSKLVQFNTNTISTSSSSKTAASGTKELTAEQAALKIQLQESNKALLDQAKAQNASVQARISAKAAIKAQFDAETQLANQQKADSALISYLQKKQSSDAINAQKEIITAQRQVQQQQRESIKSNQQEQAALKTLTNDYLLLQQAQKDQSIVYTNLLINKGKNDPATKEAFEQLQLTSTTVNDVGKSLDKATGSSENFGRSLTHGLGYLRNIAYILPGIGLAGIFDLAFSAIEKVLEQFDILGGAERKQIELVTSLQDAWTELIKVYEGVYEANKKISSLNVGSYENQEKDIAVLKARGISEDQINQKEALALQTREGATVKTNKVIVDGLKKELDINEQIKNNASEINRLQEIASSHAGKTLFGQDDSDRLDAEAQIKKLKSDNEALKQDYDETDKIVQDHYNTIQAIREYNARDDKFKSDQARKLLVETSESEISVITEKNQAIIADERRGHDERNSIIEDNFKKEKELAELQRINITGTKENPNVSATPDDIKIAKQKEYDDDKKANIKQNEDKLKNDTDYYQRLIKATTESQKDQIDSEAIAQERIFKNENKSLDDRLKSYGDYILKKQQLQEIEFKLSAQQGQSKSGDTSSLTIEETEKLQSDKVKEQLNIQADAEKQVYDIVHSSLQKQLKAVIEEGQSEGDFNKEQLIEDLTANNEKYLRKEESFKKFTENKKKILDDDGRDTLQKDIENDEKERASLQILQQQRIKDIKDSQKELDDANSLSDTDSSKKLSVDSATGKLAADQKGLADVNKQITINNKKEQDDRLKQAKLGFEDDGKARKEWVNAALEIERALYDSIKQLGDEGYEYQVELLEKRKALIDEQYGYEIDAIDKSSLSAKDKSALDIQLQAQKQQLDENTAVEERKIKIEEAEFNKKLEIANAVIGIAAAIIKDGISTPKAIADVTVGAIELATIAATPIPRFKTGIKGYSGGMAVYGEDGTEIIKKPYQSPYLVYKETIGYLPPGTDVIPIKDHPEFSAEKPDNSWEQTRWLGNQIRKNNKEIKNIFKPVINIDLGFENYKRKQIYGK